MKKTINFYDFERGFKVYNREHQFSYKGLKALFEYLEEYEESCDTELEFDPIAICCEYTEYENIEEFWVDYSNEDYPTIESIQDYTQVIIVGKEDFIVQVF